MKELIAMNNYLLFIPGNTTSDKVAYLFFLFLALGFLYFAVKKTIWLFKKDSYWYYWRYWNPFTYFFRKRYTGPWFVRLFGVALILFMVYTGIERDTLNFTASVVLLFAFILMYGLFTYVISKEDDSENSVLIRDVKRHYGKLETDEESTKEKPSKANESVADELIKLNELKEKGILSEEEFNEQKKKLLKQ